MLVEQRLLVGRKIERMEDGFVLFAGVVLFDKRDSSSE